MKSHPMRLELSHEDWCHLVALLLANKRIGTPCAEHLLEVVRDGAVSVEPKLERT